MMKKVVTLGEIMLRLSTSSNKRLTQAEDFVVNYGGAEANVAVTLSNFGLQSSFVSRVPDNAIGQSAINNLRRYGVDTQFIARGGDRLGIYFLETGVSVRPSQVVYDRSGSSITDVDIKEFDFDAIFDGVEWFHTSGITPALSDKAAKFTELALQIAQQKGITTSIDINYRKKLWSKEAALPVLRNLCQYVDVCIGADDTLGFHANENNMTNDTIEIEGFKDIFRQLKEEFDFKIITTSLRENHSASDNSYRALVYDGTAFHLTKKYEVRIVDRVGTGDAFTSGIIYGLVTGMAVDQAAEFAVASSVIKHTIPGDFNHVTLNEVMELMNGEGNSRVKR